MNKELMGALDELEREKNISKETLLDAIEQSLIQAYKNHFGKADNVQISSLLIRPDLRPLFFIIRERLYCSAFLPRAETSPVQSFGKTCGAGPPGR